MIIKRNNLPGLTKTRKKNLSVLLKLKSLFYRGTRYRCNLCKKSFRRFLSNGNVQRKNAVCPYCYSLEHSRLLYIYLKNETDCFNGKRMRVLHISPEAQLFKIFKRNKSLEYVYGDVEVGFTGKHLDIQEVKYPNNHFDIIICSHVLVRVQNEYRAIKELSRLVKPTGMVIILTEIIDEQLETIEDKNLKSPQERLEKYGDRNLYRAHGTDIYERLINGGFKEVNPNDYRLKLSENMQIKYSLGNGEREVIYECFK
ncbi:MAG: class I SAM-dependent methyltransferase [Bacteroidales bacterium]|nr:class I SAM-dependent methyltransferase [Bacteroidales bacterium]